MFRVLKAILFVGLMSLVACGGGGGGSSDSGSGDNDGGNFSSGGGSTLRIAIDQYVNNFIIATYAALESSAQQMENAAGTLSRNPSQENLLAVRAAWVQTRVYWEKSETALFGPVDIYGFDPSMDSWPVNQTDLEAVLASGASLTPASVGSLDTTLKGFHTIEYLLWGVDSQKTASQITARELEYLIATTKELHGITAALLAAWDTGYNGQPPFALELTNAGQGSASFPTERNAIEQMVQGIIGICDEVANGKIADPFDSRNPNIVESQFSFNSTIDFANNIRGAQEAYGIAVGLVVGEENPGLDAKVRGQFAAAIAAIERIPEPFRNAILDSSNDGTIIAAQQAIRALADTLQSQVLPEVLS